MRNDKNLYENVDNKDQWYIDNYWSSDDETDDKPRRSKAIAIGLIISVAVVLGAIRLWNVFQRP